jgi:micrococcal nuclease
MQAVRGPRPGAYGERARAALAKMIESSIVTCHLDGTTASSNRPVGVCYVDGNDFGEALVVSGMARDCPEFSRGRYDDAEMAAKRDGNDLTASYPLPSYC